MEMEMEKWEDYFEYLDDLRESGQTNMFGAAPYIEQRFGVDKLKAKEILTAWRKNFSDKTPAERAALYDEGLNT